jgi:tetratricopeptide (TPR) repeat protein
MLARVTDEHDAAALDLIGQWDHLRAQAVLNDQIDVALEIADQQTLVGTHDYVQLALDRAKYLDRLGRHDEAAQAFDEVATSSDFTTQLSSASKLEIGLKAALVDTRNAESRLEAVLVTARELLPADDPVRRQIERQAILHGVGFTDDEALERIDRLISDARQSGDPSEVAGLLRAKADLVCDPHAAIAVLDDALSAAAGCSDFVTWILRVDQASFLSEVDSRAGFDRFAEAFREIPRHIGATELWSARLRFADVSVPCGELEVAKRQCNAVVNDVLRHRAPVRWLEAATTRLAEVHHLCGEHAKADAAWDTYIARVTSDSSAAVDVLKARLLKAKSALTHGGPLGPAIGELQGLASDAREHRIEAEDPLRLEVAERLADARGRAGDPRAAVEGLEAVIACADGQGEGESSWDRYGIALRRLQYWRRAMARRDVDPYWSRHP